MTLPPYLTADRLSRFLADPPRRVDFRSTGDPERIAPPTCAECDERPCKAGRTKCGACLKRAERQRRRERDSATA